MTGDQNKDIEVSIILGSKSDEDVMQRCKDHLQFFNITHEQKVISAHRNPDDLSRHLARLENQGTKVVIAGAGMAAHLPGVIASQTTLPVIGVPLSGSELKGLDALYSIVQMPSGIPVATVAIGKAGAANAAILAAEILALSDLQVKAKLVEFRANGSKM